MKKLNKDNLERFLNYYHEFHDSVITNINYDIQKSEIEILIDVYWSGEPTLKIDNTYETNPIKMKMLFKGIEKCNNKELFSWDYIQNAYIKYVVLENKEFICFADDEEEPQIYIIADEIEYEEVSIWK